MTWKPKGLNLATSVRKKKASEKGGVDPATLRLPDTSITEGGYAKSVQTRLRILNAAVECLADQGYAGTTVGAVAERANLTRNAMQYHFASRMSLIEGVIHHIMRLRLQNWLDDFPRIKSGEISTTNLAWEHTKTPVFRAFTEFLVASRTNAEVSAIFTPALAEYDRVRRVVGESTTERSVLDAPWFNLRRDIVRFLLEGFAIQQSGLSFDSDKRTQEILAFLRILYETGKGEEILNQALELARKPSVKR